MTEKKSEQILIYNSGFVPEPGWEIHKTNTKIESLDWNAIRGEYWDKCRTTDVCNLYDAGNEDQVPFNLEVLLQLMQKDLVPEDWKTYLANSLPINKEPIYVNIKQNAWDLDAQFHNDKIDEQNKFLTGQEKNYGKILPYRDVPIKVENTKAHEDSRESIAFVGTVYKNHQGNLCVPALHMKPNKSLAIRYVSPREIMSNPFTAFGYTQGFRDQRNNLPSTMAYGLINL